MKARRPARRLIRDFLLIVAGVLTALGLESWNSARLDRRVELQYLTALANDLRAHIARYDDWATAFDRQRQLTGTIWSWANGSPPAATYQPGQILLWMRLGGQYHPNTRLPDGAYHDLVNSGRLGLIRDRTLREALVGYHNVKTRWIEHIETTGETAAEQYRLARQGVIPPEAAWLAAADEDLSGVDVGSILASFRARAEVRDALVAMIESHNFRAGSAARLRQHAVELLDLLEQELARRGAP